ncbi:hypothetical protein TKK_0015925 [Trichogramma kaykai]
MNLLRTSCTLAILIIYCLQNYAHAKLLPEDVIKEENYPVETHSIETEDGYLLTVHRIPNEFGIPVYLQHGILSSSLNWLGIGKRRSLPYYLWDHGFDVWIGNSRGNSYSKGHKSFKITDPEFWDFSWHEVGKYDLPAIISHIVDATKQRIFYIGHSLGVTKFAVMANQKPEVAKHVRATIGLAPAVYEKNIKQPLVRALSRFRKEFKSAAGFLRIHEFFGQNIIFDVMRKNICAIPALGTWACSNFMFFLFGYSPKQLNYDLLPTYLSEFPDGTSVKLFVHWLQQMHTDNFENFDYGRDMNLKMYNSSEPPRYNLTKIETPIAVFYSDNDLITDEKDTTRFYNEIPNKLGLYNVGHSFNHGDFLHGINATELVYQKILDIFLTILIQEEESEAKIVTQSILDVPKYNFIN